MDIVAKWFSMFFGIKDIAQRSTAEGPMHTTYSTDRALAAS